MFEVAIVSVATLTLGLSATGYVSRIVALGTLCSLALLAIITE